jgi:hypothetical protein
VEGVERARETLARDKGLCSEWQSARSRRKSLKRKEFAPWIGGPIPSKARDSCGASGQLNTDNKYVCVKALSIFMDF